MEDPGLLGLDARLLASVVLAAHDGVLITELDADGEPVIVYANPALCAQTGYELGELVGRHPRLLLGPDSDHEAQLELRRAVHERRSATVELLHYRKDGSSFWVGNTLAPVPADDGEVRSFVSIQRDITAHKEQERAIRQSEERFRSLAEHSSDVVTVVGADGTFLYTSPSVTRVLGHGTGTNGLHSAWEVVHPDDLDRVATRFAEQLAVPGLSEPVEFRAVRADRSFIWVEAVANNLLHDPSVGGMVVTIRDVTERHRADAFDQDQAEILAMAVRGEPLDATLDELATRLTRTLGGATCGIALARRHGAIELLHGTLPTADAWRLLGAPLAMVENALRAGGDAPIRPELAERIAAVVPPSIVTVVPIASGPAASTVAALVVVDGHGREADGRDAALLQRFAGLAGIAIEHDRTTRELAHQARHDALTGLANRATLLDQLERHLRQPTRDGRGVAVLLIDLDHFKRVNDSAGHARGDHLLVTIADRLGAAIRDQDLLARLGGDEFVVVSPDVDVLAAIGLANRLVETIAEPLEHGGSRLSIGASIGVAIGGVGDDPGQLLQHADAAMYQAKDRGRGRVELFEDRLRERAVRRVAIEQELHGVVERGELALHYQPVVDVVSGALTGFEALLRWNHPVRGVVSPGEIIDVAEETGQIVPIGQWVLETATAQVAAWRRHAPELHVAVNVSMRQLHHQSLGSAVTRALSTSGLPPEALVLEVTETMAMGDPALVVPVLQRMKSIGIRIAVDDFGTGYSSLDHLRRLPVDILKVDRSFARELGAGRNGTIAALVISLAHTLRLEAIAEGIETREQHQQLLALGCERAQGYLYAKPMPVDQIEALLFAGALTH